MNETTNNMAHDCSYNEIINDDININSGCIKIKKKKKIKNKRVKKERENVITPSEKEKLYEKNENNIPILFKVNENIQLNAILKSIRINYIFYITLLLCLYIFTQCSHNKSNLIFSIGSIIFITLYGYFIHYIGHLFGDNTLSNIYKSYDNIFTRNNYFNWFAEHLIYFGEFHAKIHHNTDINKTYKNIALEFIYNVILQGTILIGIKHMLKYLDNRVIILWSLLYATAHNINYNIMHPLAHQQHHINSKTNYGIDIWDIIIGSKYDWSEIENHNHVSINLLLITVVIYYVCNKFKI